MENAQNKIARLLSELWSRNRPLVEQRLQVLEKAAAACRSGALPQELRQEAESVAHKLAGTLGMFGFHEGTEIARELELQLGMTELDASSFSGRVAGLGALLFPETRQPKA